MNSLPHYLLSLLWLFVIGGGITSASASASASFKVDHQQQQHLRGLLQQHNTKNFAPVNNESSRRLSIELEHESAIEQLELERQPRIIGGAVVMNPATRYPYFALMSGRAVNGNRRSRTEALGPLQSECSGRYQDTYLLLEKHWTEAQQCSWSR
mmetsp:Transcript_36256/g.40357  ORF Transcript_36256/g.40357 Transcript_36256/m.40357 type:complete len:154 (+) Transcript_36256:243-704(+)